MNKRRATDPATAEQIIVAIELAKLGAGAPLIRELTGFAPRWIRRITRSFGQARARRLGNPESWLSVDLGRLVHGGVLLQAYELQIATHSEARRLRDAYSAYCLVVSDTPIGINRAAQIIALYRSGRMYMRPCSRCRSAHLVIAAAANHRCPVCRSMAREIREDSSKRATTLG